jgi:ABC-2 type transport system permease protein
MVCMGLKRIFRYPWGLLMSLVIDPFLLVLNIFLFKSIFAHSGKHDIAGYSLEGMVWYYACVQFIWYWIWNFTDRNVGQRIISGDFTLDLIRPVSLFSFELSRAVSLRLSGIVFEFVPSMILYSIFIPYPLMTFTTVFQFCVSAAIAFFLFYAMNFLIGLLGNYLQNTDALQAVKHIVIATLGGSLVPLEFFPSPMSDLLVRLPFASLFHWPLRFFLGMGKGWAEFLAQSAASLCWLGFFLLVNALLWKRAVRRFAGFGG